METKARACLLWTGTILRRALSPISVLDILNCSLQLHDSFGLHNLLDVDVSYLQVSQISEKTQPSNPLHSFLGYRPDIPLERMWPTSLQHQ